MANKTIFDVIQAADELKAVQDKNTGSNDPDLSIFLHNMKSHQVKGKESYLSGTIEDALSNEDPMGSIPPKKGEYKGSVYYAANMPKSEEDNVPFDKEKYELVQRAMKTGAKKSTVGKAMVYLKDIGYYDGEVDSLKGPMFMGAGQRLIYNKQDENFIEDMKGLDFVKWFSGKSKSK